MRLGRFTPLVAGAVALVAVALGFVAALSFRDTAPSPESVQALTQQEFKDLRGSPVQLADLRGQLLVVNFWATWCAPCKEEIPGLIAVQRTLPAGKATIVGIAVDSAAKVADYSASTPFNYPILIGGASTLELLRRLGNEAGGLPYTVLISSEGKIVGRHLGLMSEEALRKQLREHLG